MMFFCKIRAPEPKCLLTFHSQNQAYKTLFPLTALIRYFLDCIKSEKHFYCDLVRPRNVKSVKCQFAYVCCD